MVIYGILFGGMHPAYCIKLYGILTLLDQLCILHSLMPVLLFLIFICYCGGVFKWYIKHQGFFVGFFNLYLLFVYLKKIPI